MAGEDEKPTNNDVPAEVEGVEEEEEEYVVEEILKHKITKKNKVEFFLKWKGFGPEDNTWEPAENLNCPELIDAYLKDVPEKEKKKVRAIVGSGGDITEEEEKVKDKPTSTPAQHVNGNSNEEKKNKQQKRKATDENPPKKKKRSEKRTTGFEKGLEAEELLGATANGGEIHFLVKWKGVNEAELVPSKVANVKIPQMVIAFYEARLTWSTSSDKSADEHEENEGEDRTKKEKTSPVKKEESKAAVQQEIAAH